MQAYTSAETCLQRYILQYFGDEGEDCKKCSNCLDERELLDITIDAQKVLSCVVRMGERFGKTAVAQVLIGSKNKNIAKWNFESLSTFGIMKNHSQKTVGELIDFLSAEGYLNITSGKFPLLLLSAQGLKVLKGQIKVYRKASLIIESKTKISHHFDEECFASIRALRLELAKEEGVPPFMIFSDSALKEMAQVLPDSPSQFLQISGVGPVKLEKYGTLFIDKISEYKKS